MYNELKTITVELRNRFAACAIDQLEMCWILGTKGQQLRAKALGLITHDRVLAKFADIELAAAPPEADHARTT